MCVAVVSAKLSHSPLVRREPHAMPAFSTFHSSVCKSPLAPPFSCPLHGGLDSNVVWNCFFLNPVSMCAKHTSCKHTCAQWTLFTLRLGRTKITPYVQDNRNSAQQNLQKANTELVAKFGDYKYPLKGYLSGSLLSEPHFVLPF
jgi:hypothetical protein